MQITREISDPKVAEFVRTATEDELRLAMEEIEADAEISAAIEYGMKHNDPKDRMSADEFLVSIGYDK